MSPTRTPLTTHHKFALTGAIGLSTYALADAVNHGITGENLPYDPMTSPAGWAYFAMLLHGYTYAALAVVLLREKPRFAGTNHVARGTRMVLLFCLAVLATFFGAVAPVSIAAGHPEWTIVPVFTTVSSLAFAGLILGSTVLGLALLRDRSLGYGARVLQAMLPAFALMMLVAWVAYDFAHPAYLETDLQVGIALLGVGVVTSGVSKDRSSTDRSTQAVPQVR